MWGTGGMNLDGMSEMLGGKPVPVALRPPQSNLNCPGAWADSVLHWSGTSDPLYGL